MSNSNKKLSKLLIYVGGTVGLGLLGAHLYNKKVKKNRQLNSLEKHVLKKEVSTIFEAEYKFIEILLNDDVDTLKNKNIESVFELEAIKYALDIYHESRNFSSDEIKEIIRVWFLNNVKLIEGYLGKIEEDEVVKSVNRLENLSLKLRDTLKDINLYDSLAENLDIQKYIVGTYVEINKGVENNIPVARYIYDLSN